MVGGLGSVILGYVIWQATGNIIIRGAELMEANEAERLEIYKKIYKGGVEDLFDQPGFNKRILALQQSNITLRLCATTTNRYHKLSMTKSYS